MITSRIFKKLGSRIKASRRTFSHLVAPHPRSEAPDYYGLIQRKVMCLKAEIPSTPKLAVSNVNRHLGLAVFLSSAQAPIIGVKAYHTPLGTRHNPFSPKDGERH
jgi:hypothetical protein